MIMQFGSRKGPVTIKGSAAGLVGVREVLQHVRDMTAAHHSIAEQTIVAEGLKVFNESQELCPVDKGLLRASGRIVVKGKGFSTVIYIIYGMYYAIYVHEDPTKYHKPPTTYKFVEIPMRKYGPGVVRRIKAELAKARP